MGGNMDGADGNMADEGGSLDGGSVGEEGDIGLNDEVEKMIVQDNQNEDHEAVCFM